MWTLSVVGLLAGVAVGWAMARWGEVGRNVERELNRYRDEWER